MVPVGMSQACPSASIAGPLQQAMESTGLNNQVALDGGLVNQSVVLLGRLLRTNSGSDCLKPALVFGEIPQARHDTVVFVPPRPLERVFSSLAELILREGALALLQNKYA